MNGKGGNNNAKNKMAPHVADAFLEYMDKAEAQYWEGTSLQLNDSMRRNRFAMKGAASAALYGPGAFEASAVGFGLALAAAVPLIKAAGYRVELKQERRYDCKRVYRFERKDWKKPEKGGAA